MLLCLVDKTSVTFSMLKTFAKKWKLNLIKKLKSFIFIVISYFNHIIINVYK